MKFLQLLLFFAAVSSIFAFNCPPRNQVAKINRECRSDKDCGTGKCCEDQKNTKSCVQSASQDNYGGKDKYSNQNIDCGNVKCNSGEKCVEDRGRKSCIRT